MLYAAQGEEIRWHNLRANTVRLGFLTTKILDEVGCENGVATLFGRVNDLITIPPGKSVSLCFIRPGDLRYNVWFDAEDPKSAISPTATIRIRGG